MPSVRSRPQSRFVDSSAAEGRRTLPRAATPPPSPTLRATVSQPCLLSAVAWSALFVVGFALGCSAADADIANPLLFPGDKQRYKRFSLNYRDLMNADKRFSLNYRDLMSTGGGGGGAGYQEVSEAPRKRFSMNLNDFKNWDDTKEKRFSMNLNDFKNWDEAKEKRFSMNLNDFKNWDEVKEKKQDEKLKLEKRFTMNYQDFLRQQKSGDGDPKDKRFSMNYLDTLAVPVSGYWDVDEHPPGRQQNKNKRFSLNYRDLMRTNGGSVPPTAKRFSLNYRDLMNTAEAPQKRFSMNYKDLMAAPKKRFSMNYMDFTKNWDDQNAEKEKKQDERVKLEKKRFTMNFQDTIQGPNGPNNGGGEGGGLRRALSQPLNSILATTTAQTEDAKRAPPSPPTESALDMGGRRRGKDILSEKNLQSARNILATIDRLFAQMTRIKDFSEAVCNNPVLLRLLRIRDYLIRTTVPDHVPQRRDEARGWRC